MPDTTSKQQEELRDDLKALRKDLGTLSSITTDLRICIATLQANQNSFEKNIEAWREERLKTYDALKARMEALEGDINHVEDRVISFDKKLTYAAGAVTVVVSVFTYFVNYFAKKLGA